MHTGYKIQLSNFIAPFEEDSSAYVWVSHPDFEKDLLEKTRLHIHSSKFDRDADMDLFKATVMYNRLVKLGVKCEIVEIDYNDCRD